MLACIESCFQITVISSRLVDGVDGSSSFVADDISSLRYSSLALFLFPFLLFRGIMFYANKRVQGVRHKLHNVTLLLTITKETNTAKIVFLHDLYTGCFRS
jgi:hypothetical protein